MRWNDGRKRKKTSVKDQKTDKERDEARARGEEEEEEVSIRELVTVTALTEERVIHKSSTWLQDCYILVLHWPRFWLERKRLRPHVELLISSNDHANNQSTNPLVDICQKTWKLAPIVSQSHDTAMLNTDHNYQSTTIYRKQTSFNIIIFIAKQKKASVFISCKNENINKPCDKYLVIVLVINLT